MVSDDKFQFVERIDAILLVVFTPTYTTFSRSSQKAKAHAKHGLFDFNREGFRLHQHAAAAPTTDAAANYFHRT